MTKKPNWAEYKRAQRARERKRRREEGDQAGAYLVRSFFQHYGDSANVDGFELPLRLANMHVPTFTDDSAAQFPPDLVGLELPETRNSVERAELIVGCLIDAAAGLAGLISEYKRKEITDRIHEIETADLSGPVTRKQALADVARLKKMLDQLDKQVRWTFPQWKVTGE